jgi:hypothetical protein
VQAQCPLCCTTGDTGYPQQYSCWWGCGARCCASSGDEGPGVHSQRGFLLICICCTCWSSRIASINLTRGLSPGELRPPALAAAEPGRAPPPASAGGGRPVPPGLRLRPSGRCTLPPFWTNLLGSNWHGDRVRGVQPRACRSSAVNLGMLMQKTPLSTAAPSSDARSRSACAAASFRVSGENSGLDLQWALRHWLPPQPAVIWKNSRRYCIEKLSFAASKVTCSTPWRPASAGTPSMFVAVSTEHARVPVR